MKFIKGLHCVARFFTPLESDAESANNLFKLPMLKFI